MTEVSAGPALRLEDHVGLPAFLQGEKGKNKVEDLMLAGDRRSSEFRFVGGEEEDDSSESSSIGAVSSSVEDDRGDDGEGEVQSKLTDGALGSLDCLEESLPIKRGLSNFFTGKSKSFACLSDVGSATAGELSKPENPFNKRRRILNAHKTFSWTRRASCGSLYLPPPLTVAEADEDEENDDDDNAAARSGGGGLLPPLPTHFTNGKDKSKAFRSPRCFSLSDLQHA